MQVCISSTAMHSESIANEQQPVTVIIVLLLWTVALPHYDPFQVSTSGSQSAEAGGAWNSYILFRVG